MIDHLSVLRLLTENHVNFIVVGGLGAVFQGASVVTFDLDILHQRTPENVARLVRSLHELDAYARGDARRLCPNETHLIGPGHVLLNTRFGKLDVLGTIEATTTYDDVFEQTILLDLDGISVRVLELSRLIRSKEFANRPKDIAVLPVLRATLDEIRKKAGG
jgi:hypothetical protein